MAVNSTTQTTSLLTETVTTSLTISRSVNPDATPVYSGTLQFGTHSFLVDADGKPTSVISLNQNSGAIGLGAEEMGAIFMTPVTYNGNATVLGEVLAELMDAKILAFLTPPVVPDPPPAP